MAAAKAPPKFKPTDIPTPDELAMSDTTLAQKEIDEFLQEVKKALEQGTRHVFADEAFNIAMMRTVQDILRSRDWECEWDLGNGPPLALLSPVPKSGTIRAVPKRGLFKSWQRQRYEIFNGRHWQAYKKRR